MIVGTEFQKAHVLPHRRLLFDSCTLIDLSNNKNEQEIDTFFEQLIEYGFKLRFPSVEIELEVGFGPDTHVRPTQKHLKKLIGRLRSYDRISIKVEFTLCNKPEPDFCKLHLDPEIEAVAVPLTLLRKLPAINEDSTESSISIGKFRDKYRNDCAILVLANNNQCVLITDNLKDFNMLRENERVLSRVPLLTLELLEQSLIEDVCCI